jgi:zinc transport system permease protein
MAGGCGLGIALAIGGLITSYWYDLPPGATIVVLAIALYTLAALVRPLVVKRKAAA